MRHIHFYLLFILVFGCKSTIENSTIPILIGTYTSGTSEGIYRADFDNITGELSNLQAIAQIELPSFLALSKNKEKIYAISEIEKGKLSILERQEDGGYTTGQEISTEGSIACHVNLNEDESLVSVTNYGSGDFIVYGTKEGKLHKVESFSHQGSSVHPRQKIPHPHSSYFSKDEKYIYVLDLGTDEIVSYPITDGKPVTGQVALKMHPGDGPRHMTPHPLKDMWFVVGELSNVVWSIRAKADWTFEIIDKQNLIPADSELDVVYTSSDVHTSPSGRYLYVAIRGLDSIAIFKILDSGKLEPVGHASEGIKQPRNFCLSPNGKFLIVANRYKHDIVVFKVNHDGTLEPTGHSIEVSMPVCLVF